MKPKRGWYVFWLFFKKELFSAISFKRSWRELSIDVAEHWSMLKNDRNTLPVLVSYRKHRYSIPQNGGLVFTVIDLLLFWIQVDYTIMKSTETSSSH